MTDLELLGFAAKAAGGHFQSGVFFTIDGPDGDHEEWNPLTDDGDALRLGVSLMEFEPYKSSGRLPCIYDDVVKTRRAIVRAAAEIGKSMP